MTIFDYCKSLFNFRNLRRFHNPLKICSKKDDRFTITFTNDLANSSIKVNIVVSDLKAHGNYYDLSYNFVKKGEDEYNRELLINNTKSIGLNSLKYRRVEKYYTDFETPIDKEFVNFIPEELEKKLILEIKEIFKDR